MEENEGPAGGGEEGNVTEPVAWSDTERGDVD